MLHDTHMLAPVFFNIDLISMRIFFDFLQHFMQNLKPLCLKGPFITSYLLSVLQTHHHNGIYTGSVTSVRECMSNINLVPNIKLCSCLIMSSQKNETVCLNDAINLYIAL